MRKIIREIKEFFVERKAERSLNQRKKNLLTKCGNVCFCPECADPLNDYSDCKVLDEEGLVEYTCAKCQYKSIFHFGIAPVPIYIKETEWEK